MARRRQASSPWPTPTPSPVLMSMTSKTHRTGGMDMRRRLLRTPRGNDVEVGVAIPIGCMVALAIAAAVLVGAGVLLGVRYRDATALPPDRVTVRVIDDGAGGPRVMSTQVVPLP